MLAGLQFAIKSTSFTVSRLLSTTVLRPLVTQSPAVMSVAASTDAAAGPVPVKIQEITENSATLAYGTDDSVFYNPIQEFNRDLSTLAIQAHINRRRAADDAKIAKAAAKGRTRKAVPGARILEALSATGLRSIRFWKELTGVDHIICNDLLPEAVAAIKANVEHNGICPESQVVPNEADASLLLYQCRPHVLDPNRPTSTPKNHTDGPKVHRPFDVVDLDPYGTATPFLDGAVQAVADGGLVMVTCTDAAVLASTANLSTCYSRYGGAPVAAAHNHETALRILMHQLSTSAARYRRVIKPVVAFKVDFYVRVFVEVHDSAALSKEVGASHSLIHQCSGCPAFAHSPMLKKTSAYPQKVQKTIKHINKGITADMGPNADPAAVVAAKNAATKEIREKSNSVVKMAPGRLNIDALMNSNGSCKHCGSTVISAGPVWNGPLHNREMVADMVKMLDSSHKDKFGTEPRIRSMLHHASSEIPDPFFYDLGAIQSSFKGNGCSLDGIRSALENAGHSSSLTHTTSGAFKTSAGPGEVYGILRKFWAKGSGKSDLLSQKGNIRPTTLKLRDGPVNEDADFTLRSSVTTTPKGITLYPKNPTANWGPKARAGRTDVGVVRPRVAKNNKIRAENRAKSQEENKARGLARRESVRAQKAAIRAQKEKDAATDAAGSEAPSKRVPTE